MRTYGWGSESRPTPIFSLSCRRNEQDPVLQQSFARMAEAAQQRLIVVVGADDWAEARRAADAYRAVLKSRDDLMQLNEHVTDQALSDGLAQFQRHRALLFTGQDEAALRDQGKEYWVDVALTQPLQPVRRSQASRLARRSVWLVRRLGASARAGNPG